MWFLHGAGGENLNEVPGGRAEEVCCWGTWQSSTDTVPSSLEQEETCRSALGCVSERRQRSSLLWHGTGTATARLKKMWLLMQTNWHQLSRVYPQVAPSITAWEVFQHLVFHESEVSWWCSLCGGSFHFTWSDQHLSRHSRTCVFSYEQILYKHLHALHHADSNLAWTEARVCCDGELTNVK